MVLRRVTPLKRLHKATVRQGIDGQQAGHHRICGHFHKPTRMNGNRRIPPCVPNRVPVLNDKAVRRSSSAADPGERPAAGD